MKQSIGYNIRKFVRSYTEYPLIEIKDRISNQPSKNQIPSTVFQTWETRYLGKTHSKSIEIFNGQFNQIAFIVKK